MKKSFAMCDLVRATFDFVRPGWPLLLIVSFLSLTAHAQNAVFTYQGRVTSNGTNFTGTGQFKFALVTSTNFSSTATATANPPSGGFITIINVTFGGSGYASPPVVTISGGGGAGATAHANISGGVVTSILVDNPGSGYSSTPAVTVAPPPANILFTTYWSNDGTSVNGSEPAAAVNVSVNNGLFVAVLGETAIPNMAALPASLFAQPNLQLRIWFNNGVNGFAVLTPPQDLTPTPYAIRSLNANVAATATTALSANAVAATNITGPIPLSQLQGAVVTNNQIGVNLTGSFSGNGGALSNLSPNALVLSSAGTSVLSWGNNQYGQRNAPAGLIDVVAVAAAISHSLALRSNGTVVAWGGGTTIDPSNQVESGQSIVPTGLVAKAISAGYLHSLALRFDGTVVAWGAGKTNDPANGLNYGQSIVPPGLNSVKAISAGVIHNLALLSNSTVVAWGGGFTNNPDDQFEAGQSAVPPGLSNIIAVSAGYAHSLALRANGTVVAWGAGLYDDPTNGVHYGQSIVPPGLTNVIAIVAGAVHSLALKFDGTVVAWGAGKTNTPTNGIHYGQSAVPAGLNNVIAIAAGIYHSVALKADGTVVVWGSNQFGETNVPPGLKNVLAIAPGCIAAHVLVIRPQSTAPVAWLDSDNTFDGNVRVNGDVQISGTITVAGDISITNGLRLHDKDLFLRKGTDEDNGLGWYGADKLFGTFPINGPVLYGSGGGALGVIEFGNQQPILSWTNGQRVGIGTTAPGARLSLGGDSANTKLLLRDDGNGGGIGLGISGDQFRFHLSGNVGAFFPKFSFVNGPSGNEVFSISDVGVVRLGPTAQFLVPGASENLRILRGRIAGPTGNITTGSGFTASRTGTGAYTITFSTAFTGEPTITATVLISAATRSVTLGTVNASSALFRTWDTGGAAIDQDFNFIAIGPR